eukprot:TRINITY_DN2859_c0_g1_i1.p1 TRINITY_DN2859_c0_g1~~TRINITY_DN2859_c0_g1_i1.p1  ORF type:complete len:906 (+),score=81.47 TRINITY_DN2859_c0_g1_i1:110-2827(+)
MVSHLLILTCLVLAIVSLPASTQRVKWVKLAGNSTWGSNADYDGTDANPGTIIDSLALYDNARRTMWLFGGIKTFFPAGDVSNVLWNYTVGSTLSSSYWKIASGTPTIGAVAGVYGPPGVSSPTATPGSRHSPVGFMDGDEIWVFSGRGYGITNVSLGELNDMWKYNVVTRLWTFIGGNNVTSGSGSYGTKGIEAPTNLPPPRVEAGSWYDDVNREFWVFAGQVGTSPTRFYNDLWRFKLSTLQWTWMGGANTTNDFGSFGDRYNRSVSWLPRSRSAPATWMDTEQRLLYLFGGYTSAIVHSDELWTYNITDGTWGWITGTPGVGDRPANGTRGVPSTYGTPGGRHNPTSWMNAQRTEAFIYGGRATRNSETTGLDDIWKFNLLNQTWTWIDGTGLNSRPPSGAIGMASANNTAGGRSYHATFYDENTDELWLYGGENKPSSTVGFRGVSDFWYRNSFVMCENYLSGFSGLSCTRFLDSDQTTVNVTDVALPFQTGAGQCSQLGYSRIPHVSCGTADCVRLTSPALCPTGLNISLAPSQTTLCRNNEPSAVPQATCDVSSACAVSATGAVCSAECQTSSPLAGATCIYQSWFLSNNQNITSLDVLSSVVINGDAVFGPGSATTIVSLFDVPAVRIIGCATFSGTLDVFVSSQQPLPASGTFTLIEFESGFCGGIRTTPSDVAISPGCRYFSSLSLKYLPNSVVLAFSGTDETRCAPPVSPPVAFPVSAPSGAAPVTPPVASPSGPSPVAPAPDLPPAGPAPVAAPVAAPVGPAPETSPVGPSPFSNPPVQVPEGVPVGPAPVTAPTAAAPASVGPTPIASPVGTPPAISPTSQLAPVGSPLTRCNCSDPSSQSGSSNALSPEAIGLIVGPIAAAVVVVASIVAIIIFKAPACQPKPPGYLGDPDL